MLGKKLQTLANGMQLAGEHSIAVDLNGYCDGTYLCRIETAVGNATKLFEGVNH
jgi:hypothetical protein